MDYAMHGNSLVMVMLERICPIHGKYAHVQKVKPCGGLYGVRERKANFQQYELVKFSELTPFLFPEVDNGNEMHG